MPSDDVVFASFSHFASDGAKTLDSAKFSRWITSCQLDIPIVDVDLIFTKAKDKGQRRIDYRLFKIRVLPMLARKAGISIDETKQILAAAVKLPLSGSNNSDGSTSNPSKPRNSAETSLPVVPSELVEIFQAAFALFAAPGSGGSAQEMDSTRFCKMCKDCGLLSKRLKTNNVDIVFKKAKSDPTKRKITLDTFINRAIPLLSVTSKQPLDKMAHDISLGRPSLTGSIPKTDTGIFSKLTRPSSQSTDRSKIKKTIDKEDLVPVPLEFISSLKDAFRAFCAFGFHGLGKAPDTLDNVKFCKMLRESGLISKRFSNGDADLTFQKSLSIGARRLSAAVFLEFTVPFLAHKLGKDTGVIAQQMASARPSTSNATEIETSGIFGKLTDETLYTGMYAAIAGQDVEELFLGNRLEHMLMKTELPELPVIYMPGLRAGVARFSDDPDCEMSESSFFRLIRDAGLVNHRLSYSDVSMVHNLCKEEYAEGLDFQSYCKKAIPLMTSVRDDDIHRVAKKLVDAHPESALSRMKRAMRKATIFDKLCDPTLFTGMHRFKTVEKKSPEVHESCTGNQPSGKSNLQGEGLEGHHPKMNLLPGRPHTSQGIRSTPCHRISGGTLTRESEESPVVLYSFLPPRPFTADNHPLMLLRPGMKPYPPDARILRPIASEFRDTALTLTEVADQYYFSGTSSSASQLVSRQLARKTSLLDREFSNTSMHMRPDFDTQICFFPDIVI